jgi:hypothetical protein
MSDLMGSITPLDTYKIRQYPVKLRLAYSSPLAEPHWRRTDSRDASPPPGGYYRSRQSYINILSPRRFETLQECTSTPHTFGRTGTASASKIIGNRKHTRNRLQKWDNKTKIHTSYGHAFYWVKDRVKQGQFHVYWGPGYQNSADFFTKHQSPAHH